MSRRTRALLSMGLLVLIFSHAHAALLEIDYATPGDGLITRDTGSGLDWLDLSPTFSQSFAVVEAGYGGFIDAGFRYANRAEVVGLYEAFGIPTTGYPVPPGTDIPGTVAGYYSFLEMLGGAAGIYPDPGGGSDTPIGVSVTALFASSGGTLVATAYVPLLYIGADETPPAFSLHGYTGSYLVRPSIVPVPATLPLFASGLGGLGWLARRKQLAA